MLLLRNWYGVITGYSLLVYQVLESMNIIHEEIDYCILSTGTINEWDQHGLGCIGSVEAMGSPIWCIGADHAHQRLAAGTDNGKVL